MVSLLVIILSAVGILTPISRVVSTECTIDGELLYTANAPCDKQCPNIIDVQYTCTEGQSNVCRCQPGLVRTASNVCVPEEKCPHVCNAADEVIYSNLCNKNFPCGPAVTCKQFYSITGEPIMCPMACLLVSICACRPAYLKNDDGKCIPISKCPKPTCNPGEIFYTDCAPCDKPCPNVFNPKYTCTYECRINQCRCSPGHYRNEKNICVPEANCSTLCKGPNEIYYSGYKCISCDSTCENWYRKDSFCAVDVCLTCICKPGFVRKAGVCVPIEECPPICGSGEQFYKPGEYSPCCLIDQDCQNKATSNICDCKPGYKRTNSTTCTQNPSC